MDLTYWQRQTEKRLFPELEWNKPERRDQAGRLLIIGGYQHNLNAPATAYEIVKEQGIGDVKVALPDKTKTLLGKNLPSAVFLPSTSSGELAHEAIEELVNYASWADTILVAGDVGRNSQTTLLISDIVQTTTNQTVITKDALDALQNSPQIVVDREATTLVASFAQLQRIFQNLKLPTALTFTMDLVRLVEVLHDFTKQHPSSIVTLHQDKLVMATDGHISTTSVLHHSKKSVEPSQISPQGRDDDPRWRTKYAAIAACYQTWNPGKTFEALTYSAAELSK